MNGSEIIGAVDLGDDFEGGGDYPEEATDALGLIKQEHSFLTQIHPSLNLLLSMETLN